MKKIVVDLDGTLIERHMKGLCSEYVGHEIDSSKIPRGMYLNNYFMCDEFKEFFRTHNLYDYGVLLPECDRVLKLLNEKYDVTVCSGWIFDNMEEFVGLVTQRKYEFLRNKFPFLEARQMNFAGDKNIVSADIAIGDSLSDMVGTELNILIKTTYKDVDTTGVKNLKIVKSWSQIEELLK